MRATKRGGADTAPVQTKSDLLDRMAETHRDLETVISTYDEVALIRHGAEGWSVKDHLSHLAVWEAPLRALLEGHSMAEALGIDQEIFKNGGIELINKVIHYRHQDESLSIVLHRFRQSRQDTLTLLERFSDDDLRQPYSFYRPSVDPPRHDPVIYWIAGSTYQHDAQHLTWIRDLL